MDDRLRTARRAWVACVAAEEEWVRAPDTRGSIEFFVTLRRETDLRLSDYNVERRRAGLSHIWHGNDYTSSDAP